MIRKLNFLLLLTLILLPTLTACQPAEVLARGGTLQLGSVTENYVEVSIALQRSQNDTYTLTATFTPLEAGLHLYSKDIPPTGVDGLGRPTLLTLPTDSALMQVGETMESQPTQAAFEGPSELRVYPEGPITLSIPVLLPDGQDWLNQQVLVTYMACSDRGCRAPVENKSIAIRIPTKGMLQ
ncbi:MAG: hypothetical protein HYZ25_15050 [Chloroflexi bacterium]|nr:hypothetical protein [Chloroflexota bacterium]